MRFVSMLVALFAVWAPASRAAPAIQITSLPPYAVNGFLSGNVTDVDSATHVVATYIHVEGSGWWTKPTELSPTVPIAPDGTYSVNVATGGLDNRAVLFCVAVVPDSASPPVALGAVRVPASLNSIAVATTCEERYGRTLAFAGRTWAVKDAPLPVGPGSNVFASDTGAVFVDGLGRLQLTLRFDTGCHIPAGCWWATEVVLLEDLGHGTYLVQSESEVDDLDPNVTFGIFTWDSYGDDESTPGSANREIDFEDSRWGKPLDPENSQAVVQPWDVAGNRHRFPLPDLAADPRLTRFFRWEPEEIRFLSLTGHHDSLLYPASSVIDEKVYRHDPGMSHYVPAAGRARLRLNLWMNAGSPPQPLDGQEVEVIVSDFRFTPLSATLPLPLWSTEAAMLLLAALGGLLAARGPRRPEARGVGA